MSHEPNTLPAQLIQQAGSSHRDHAPSEAERTDSYLTSQGCKMTAISKEHLLNSLAIYVDDKDLPRQQQQSCLTEAGMAHGPALRKG